jgi:heat-inducible transcriptional repressor
LEILIENLEEDAESGNVVSTGSSKMLDYPEFRDVEKAKNFFALLEQHDLITKALKSSSKPNAINVTIGVENPLTELQDFSIVTSNIIVDGKDLGVFGILGPTRMEYSKVVSILEQVTNYLVKTLSTML